MRFFLGQISWLAIHLTGFSLLLSVNGKNLDAGASATVSDVRGGWSDEDSPNRTNLDSDYGYKLDQAGKSSDKDKASVSLAQAQEEDEQATYGGCDSPIIANGAIQPMYRDGIDRQGPRMNVSYVCSEGYTSVGNGLLICDGLHWQPSPDTVCLRTCPELKSGGYSGSLQPAMRLEPVDTSGLYTIHGPYMETTRWRFRCLSGWVPKYSSQYLLECGGDGQWKLLNSQSMPVAGVVQDSNDLCEVLNEPCQHLPSKPGVTIRYKSARSGSSSTLLSGDEAVVSCKQPNYVLQSSKRDPTLIFRCLANGHWANEEDIASFSCVSIGCLRPISGPQLKPVYEEQDTRSHRQIFADGDSVIRHGVRIFYRCDDPDRYYLVGDTEYVCNTNGTWSPPYWPKCERKKRCSAVDFPNDGYYNTNPNSDGFEPGHTLTFGCIDGFRLEGRTDLKCLDNGEWNFHPPACIRDEWSTKRFVAVTSVACLLGVLLVVLLGFFLQRHLLLRKALGTARRHRLLDSGGSESRLRFASMNSCGVSGGRGHHQHPQLLASAARAGPAAFDSDPDRLALIAFADGVQVPLPTYEEAVSQAINERRCHPPPFDAISTLSGYCSRAVRRLPSLSSLRSTRDGSLGNGAPNSPRVHASNGGDNQQRSRLREQWSSTSGSNVSSQSHGQHNRHVGSNETVAVSDVSTNITLETVSTGGQSQTASARAYAGSLSSILSSNAGGPTTSVPVVALSVCSASSMASSIGSGGSSTSAGVSSAMGGSQSEGLPLLESQELDVNQEDYEGYSSEQRQQAVDNSDEMCSQKSLEV